MSKVLGSESPHQFFKTNRDKLVELLLNEITFLDQCFYKSNSVEERGNIMVALETFENLLKDKNKRENLGNNAKKILNKSKGATERNIFEIKRLIRK